MQSGVSATIKTLEADLGTKLLERTSKRVGLTDAGVALLERAREILDAAQDARDAVDAVRGGLSGHIRIGTITARGCLDLPAVLGDFRKTHPAVRFTLTLAARGSSELADAVMAGRLDLAVTSLPELPAAKLNEQRLGSSPMALVVPEDHRLAAAGSATLGDLAHETFVDFSEGYGSRLIVDRAFRQAKVERDVALEIADSAMGAEFVARGLGIAILPVVTIPDRPRTRRIALEDPTLLWPLSIITSKRRAHGAALRALLEAVGDYVDDACSER